MQELFTLGRPVDFITVLEKLKENSDFEEATGKVYLTQLAQIVPPLPTWKFTPTLSGTSTTCAP